jgi:hypothetical protein
MWKRVVQSGKGGGRRELGGLRGCWEGVTKGERGGGHILKEC